MKTLEIKIAKNERNPAWGEHLIDNGFERDQFDDRYNKRHVIWSKDGIDYKAKPESDSEGNLILTLTEFI